MERNVRHRQARVNQVYTSQEVMTKVLIVDDDPSIRFMIRLSFEGAGYDVMEAEHGGVALERVKESRPNAVITDLMMPVLGGLALIRQLRSNPDTSMIPIVVVSGKLDDDTAVRGADAMLPKPFLPAELVQMVGSLLRAQTKLDT